MESNAPHTRRSSSSDRVRSRGRSLCGALMPAAGLVSITPRSTAQENSVLVQLSSRFAVTGEPRSTTSSSRSSTSRRVIDIMARSPQHRTTSRWSICSTSCARLVFRRRCRSAKSSTTSATVPRSGPTSRRILAGSLPASRWSSAVRAFARAAARLKRSGSYRPSVSRCCVPPTRYRSAKVLVPSGVIRSDSPGSTASASSSRRPGRRDAPDHQFREPPACHQEVSGSHGVTKAPGHQWNALKRDGTTNRRKHNRFERFSGRVETAWNSRFLNGIQEVGGSNSARLHQAGPWTRRAPSHHLPLQATDEPLARSPGARPGLIPEAGTHGAQYQHGDSLANDRFFEPLKRVI